MKTESTEVVRYGLLTKRRVTTVGVLLYEFPYFLHQVVLRRMHIISGVETQPFLLNVATSILIGYHSRFVNTEHAPFRMKP